MTNVQHNLEIHFQELAAKRVKELGHDPSQFEVWRIGEDSCAGVVVKYTPTTSMRIYALNIRNDLLHKSWVDHFIKELQAGLFHDPSLCDKQYDHMQIDISKRNHDWFVTQWRDDSDRKMLKWRDYRESNLRWFFSLSDGAKHYASGYLRVITTLNAGAVIALLTFTHKAIDSAKNCDAIDRMISQSWPFLIGLGFAMLAMACAYWSYSYTLQRYRKTKNQLLLKVYVRGADFFGVVSAIAFFYGAYLAMDNIPLLRLCINMVNPASP